MSNEIRNVASLVAAGVIATAATHGLVHGIEYISNREQRLMQKAELYSVIAQQKLPELAAWMQLYKNVEERSRDGYTPLQAAIQQNWGPAVEFLIGKGANTNAVREVPNARLFKRLLIATGNAADLQRESTLDVAIKTKNPESIRLVVEGGAMINAQNFRDLKNLMPMIIQSNNVETVSYFLDLLYTKADKEMMGQYLPLALEHKCYDVVPCLIKKFSFDKAQAVELFSQIKEQETNQLYAQMQPGLPPQSKL